jgi:hypothetical protein
MVEKYTRADRRASRRERVAAVRQDRRVSGVRWSAILAGTLASVVAYGLMAASIVAASDGDPQAGWIAAGAAAVVPVLMFLLAFLTRAEAPVRLAATTSAVVIAVFMLGSFAVRDVATGYVLALGLGATFAMRLDETVHDRRWRILTAVGLAAYTKVVYLISPSIAVATAPMLPIFGISIVDSVHERRMAG